VAGAFGDSRAANLAEGTLLVSLAGLSLIALSVVKAMRVVRSSYVAVLILGVCLAIARMLFEVASLGSGGFSSF
jgi:hypothetical protein